MTENKVEFTPQNPNVFQKLWILLFIVILIVSLFFIPQKEYSYNETYTIVFEPLWAESYSFDWTRIVIAIVLLSAIFVLIFRSLKKLSGLEEKKYKRRGRIEVISFFLFIICLLTTLICTSAYNFININRKLALETRIRNSNGSIAKIEKVEKRNKFFEVIEQNKPLELIPYRNPDLYWKSLEKKIEDSIWVETFYSSFNYKLGTIEEWRKLVLPESKFGGLPIIDLPGDNPNGSTENLRDLPTPKEALQGIYNILKNDLNIKSATEFKKFIQTYSLTNDDILLLATNAINKYNIQILTEKKENIQTLERNEKRKIFLYTFFLSFILLFILRPAISLLIGVFKELK